jgi:hypothetical protein
MQQCVFSPWQVPMVDLFQSDEVVLGTLKRACTSTGFFYGANDSLQLPCLIHHVHQR